MFGSEPNPTQVHPAPAPASMRVDATPPSDADATPRDKTPPGEMRVADRIPSARKAGSGQAAMSKVEQRLSVLDRNNDGVLERAEVVAAVESLLKEEELRRNYATLTIGLTFTILILVAALTGMTYGIIELTKDTNIDSETLVVKGTHHVVQTASSDFHIVDGALVPRISNRTAAGRRLLSSNTPPAVLRTAPYTLKQAFSSRVPISALMELKFLYLQGANHAELALLVLGVARVEANVSRWGTVVRILTAAGTITLDDTAISFNSDMSPVFIEGGFVVDPATTSSSRRRLAGVYEVLGFFAYIADLDIFNLPAEEKKPRLPTGAFTMTLVVYEPCVETLEGNITDRCSLVSSYTDGESNETVTTYTDMPGTKVVDGQRFMTHTEAVVKNGDMVRTVYLYEGWPNLIRTEVANMATRQWNGWLESVGGSNGAGRNIAMGNYMCRSASVPDTVFDTLQRKSDLSSNGTAPGIDFTFLGFETKLGMGARHFQLTVPQRPTIDTVPSVVIVHYWDLTDAANTPLVLEASVGSGSVHIEFRNVVQLQTPPDASFFAIPSNSTCNLNPPQSSGVLWLHSPFLVPPRGLPYGGYVESDETITSIEASALASFQSWNVTKYADGSGRRLLAGSCSSEGLTLSTPPRLPCSATLLIQTTDIGGDLTFGCSADIVPGLVSASGTVKASWCMKDRVWAASGCIGIGFGSFTKMLGENAPSVLSIEICGGYDSEQSQAFVSGSFSLWALVFKFELSATIKIQPGCCSVANAAQGKPCGNDFCSWLDDVQLSAYVGVDLGIWSYWKPTPNTPKKFIDSENAVFFQGSAATLKKMRLSKYGNSLNTDKDTISSTITPSSTLPPSFAASTDGNSLNTDKDTEVKAVGPIASTLYKSGMPADFMGQIALAVSDEDGKSVKEWKVPFTGIRGRFHGPDSALWPDDQVGLAALAFKTPRLSGATLYAGSFGSTSSGGATSAKSPDERWTDPAGYSYASAVRPMPDAYNAFTTYDGSKVDGLSGYWWEANCPPGQAIQRVQVKTPKLPVQGGPGADRWKLWGSYFPLRESKSKAQFLDVYSIGALKIGCVSRQNPSGVNWVSIPPSAEKQDGSWSSIASCEGFSNNDQLALACGFAVDEWQMTGKGWDSKPFDSDLKTNKLQYTSVCKDRKCDSSKVSEKDASIKKAGIFYPELNLGRIDVEWSGIGGIALQCCADLKNPKRATTPRWTTGN